MIIPAIYIEGENTFESIEFSVNCLRESVCSPCIVSKDDLDLLTRNTASQIVEASIEINSRKNTLTEKWILSYQNDLFSLRLQRVFSINGVYEEYRNLELLAQKISKSLFRLKIFFIKQGLSLYVDDSNATKDALSKLEGFGTSIFWDQ